MSRYSQKSPNNYAEPVIDVVRLVVAAHRQNGTKTAAALEISAPEIQIKPRRLRQLFERDRTPYVGIEEFDRALVRGAAILRGLAARQRESADRWDAEADWMEKRHKDLRGADCCTSDGEDSSRKSAA